MYLIIVIYQWTFSVGKLKSEENWMKNEGPKYWYIYPQWLMIVLIIVKFPQSAVFVVIGEWTLTHCHEVSMISIISPLRLLVHI